MSLGSKTLKPKCREYIIPMLAMASLMLSCIFISSKKYFWIDELFSFYLLSDPSFQHMMVAFSDKFTNVPPLYFILGWVWANVLGSSELSLRLFSSLGISSACVIIWFTLRRTFNFWSTSIGTLLVFSISQVILYQNSEARMYGLFLALCSLGVLHYDSVNRSKKSSKSLIIAGVVIHGAIVLTHLFGVFYSGAIVGALIFRDRYFKVFRLKLYLSLISSWFILIPYLPAFFHQADAGNPRGWIATPNLSDLISVYQLSSFSVLQLILLVLVAVFSLIFVFWERRGLRVRGFQSILEKTSCETSLIILAWFLLVVPILVWIISRQIRPIFVDRYLISSQIAWCIFVALISSRVILLNSYLQKKIKKNHQVISYILKKSMECICVVIVLFLILNPLIYAMHVPAEKIPGSSDDKYGYQDLPMVIPFSHDFAKRFHYSENRNRYYFVLDWESAVDIRAGLFSPQEYKTMQALRRSYPSVFQDNIVNLEEFLGSHEKFLILDALDYKKRCLPQDFHCSMWLESKVKDNPNFIKTPIGPNDGRELILVERKKHL